MADILTIPKKLIRKGELVIVPRAEYEEAIKTKNRLLWEEKDADEAIRIFEKERKSNTLKKASAFSEILGRKNTRR